MYPQDKPYAPILKIEDLRSDLVVLLQSLLMKSFESPRVIFVSNQPYHLVSRGAPPRAGGGRRKRV